LGYMPYTYGIYYVELHMLNYICYIHAGVLPTLGYMPYIYILNEFRQLEKALPYGKWCGQPCQP